MKNIKIKKIVSSILVTVFLLSMTACDSSTNKGNNSESTVQKEEPTTEIKETDETTTEVEESTSVKNHEVSTSKFTSETLLYDSCSIFDYKEDLKEIFNNREYKNGDIIDCREEIKSLGYDLHEYGFVFSFIYSVISGARGVNFEYIEVEEDYFAYPAINENQNFVLKNNTEDPFKITVEFDDTTIYFTTQFIE